MMAECEDLQASEASEIYVQRFESQGVFVKGEDEFLGGNGILESPSRSRPSLAHARHSSSVQRKKEYGPNGEFFFWCVATQTQWNLFKKPSQ